MRAEVIRCDAKGCTKEILAASVDSSDSHGWYTVNDGKTIAHYCSLKHLQDTVQ